MRKVPNDVIEHFHIGNGKIALAGRNSFQHRAHFFVKNAFKHRIIFGIPFGKPGNNFPCSALIEVSAIFDSRQLFDRAFENIALELRGVKESSKFKVFELLRFVKQSVNGAVFTALFKILLLPNLRLRCVFLNDFGKLGGLPRIVKPAQNLFGDVLFQLGAFCL